MAPAAADPPVIQPTILPPVFCFRFTDITAVQDDEGNDKFQVSFEVLNWTDQPVSGVRIALNDGTTQVIDAIDNTPSFAGAGIDRNGRAIGADSDPLPGNMAFNNRGDLLESTSTAIEWSAVQQNRDTFEEGPIPFRDLLTFRDRVPVNGSPSACALVPGCRVVGNTPIIDDQETIDNGENVLDGFVFTIDDLDETEGISFNWNLLDADGNAIGMPGVGNEMGFGTVNLFRLAVDENGELEEEFSNARIFPENTGLRQTTNVFADESYRVTAFGPDEGFDKLMPRGMAVDGPALEENWSSLHSAEDSGGVLAMFAAEFGAGLTINWLNADDNTLGSSTNTTALINDSSDGGDSGGGNPGGDGSDGGNSGDGGGGSTKVPEPGAVGAFALMGGLLARYKRRLQK